MSECVQTIITPKVPILDFKSPEIGHHLLHNGQPWACRAVKYPRLYVSLKGMFHAQSEHGNIEISASYAAYIPATVEHACVASDQGAQILSIDLFPSGKVNTNSAPRRIEDSYSYYLISALMSRSLNSLSEVDLDNIEKLSIHLFKEDCKSETCWCSSIIEAISASIKAPPSLEHLADMAGMHPMTLTKKFRRLHGCSMGEFRRRVRAERAFYRVIKEPAPLSDVSLTCGYADQSHMTREFRCFFGLTPAFLRRTTECVFDSGH
ncbi:helix-turn-helix domain-containing protein [Hyphococcus flavus]|uniref:Helix-turn-helix domain-containing protein n=1 Tax=Hyphococcus flavus TaxID=1866326 RepID=A0AAE9ZJQ6_9PROT|nr:helix-turn-helix domain-containing protein [Hyphococcus flavus]WDI31845.1 helix-turn-helix domain-containing protein [Hyphococcus flavus]